MKIDKNESWLSTEEFTSFGKKYKWVMCTSKNSYLGIKEENFTIAQRYGETIVLGLYLEYLEVDLPIGENYKPTFIDYGFDETILKMIGKGYYKAIYQHKVF